MNDDNKLFEASDEEVESQVEQRDNAPQEEVAEPSTDPSTMTDEELDSVIAEEPEQEDPDTPDTAPKSAPDTQQNKTETTPGKPDTVSIPKSEYDKVMKQNKELQSFAGKQSTEIGKNRKIIDSIFQNPEAGIALLKQKAGEQKGSTDEGDLFEQLTENPDAVIRKVLSTVEAEKTARAYAIQQSIVEKDAILAEHAPRFKEMAPEIVRILKEEDNFSQDDVVQFIDNWAHIPVDSLLNLHDRAVKAQRIRGLEEENERLRTQPDRILDKINKVTRTTRGPSVSGVGTAKKKPTVTYSSQDMSRMSESELEAYITQQ